MEQLSPRPATTDDLPAMAALEAKVQPKPWTEEHFQQELDKPYSETLVLTDDETDEQVHGYIVFWLMEEDGEILNLAVDPRLQRQGLARNLTNRVVSMALKKGLGRLKLNVRTDNAPAIEFYQKCGFTSTHRRKGFYSDGCDGYEMELDLTDDPLTRAF